VPETCRELKNRINKYIKIGASRSFSARKTSIMSCGFKRIDINSGHLLTHPQTTNIYESVKNS
jgi:hypothetical protein